MKHIFSKQFINFLLAGGIAALVNFGSRMIYNHWVSFPAAVVLAYLTGMITAFALAKSFVFQDSTQPMRRSVLFFCLVNLVAAVQTWVISMALAYYVLPWLGIEHFAREIAHAIGVAVPVFTSYVGHKYFSFR